MNQKNNQQYLRTDEKIQAYLLSAIKDRELNTITVAEICKSIGINRSSFYLHYQDVYDLMDKLCQKYLGQVRYEMQHCIEEKEDYSKPLLILLTHIKENPNFYRAYFSYGNAKKMETTISEMISQIFIPGIQSLGTFSEHQIEYHFVFIMNGILAMLRRWLSYGCPETPAQMSEFITQSMSAFSDYQDHTA